jgi:heptosyltransferase I
LSLDGKQLRILITRLGAMGDILHAMPAVAALRRLHPGYFLGWVIEPRWEPLLRTDNCATQTSRAGSSVSTETAPRCDSAMPLVDIVHVAHARGWARAPLHPVTWRAVRTLREDLRRQHYDLVIDLQGAIRSAWIGRMAGAPLVGEAQPREAPAKWFFHRRVPTHGVHVIEQATEVVAAAVGASLEPDQAPFPVNTAAERWCDAVLGSDARPVVLINPGAGWGAKRWPTQRYGTVARRLCEQGSTVFINAGPGEHAMAEQVVLASEGRARVLPMTLEQLIALTRRTALTIAGDTGPLHLACALGRPVVAIFGPTDPARNGPYGVASQAGDHRRCDYMVLRHPASKRDHSRRHAPEAGLLSITDDEVTAAALTLLEKAERA